MDVTACSSLPTPTVCGRDNRSAYKGARVRPSLQSMARKNLWPTITATDAKGRAYTYDRGDRESPRDSLTGAARRWPTPTVADGRGYRNPPRIAIESNFTRGVSLKDAVMMGSAL